MTEPDDKELQDYLHGDSKLSRAYREASHEQPPAHLDRRILAQARAAVRPGWTRALAPVALAASVVLGVNLGWNLYRQEPLSPEAVVPLPSASAPPSAVEEKQGSVAAPETAPPPAGSSQAPASPSVPAERREAPATPEADDAGARSAVAPEPARQKSMGRQDRNEAVGALEAQSPAADVSVQVPAAAQEIERLLTRLESMRGAAVAISGRDYTPAQAAVYLRVQWREAADRVRTVEDFLEVCASRSPATGEPYLLRNFDGTSRPLAEVLREIR